MNKPGLTLDEHRAMGRRLKALRDELVNVSIEIGHFYALGSKVGRTAPLIAEQIGKLRSALDDACAAEHPEGFEPSIYYGAEERS